VVGLGGGGVGFCWGGVVVLVFGLWVFFFCFTERTSHHSYRFPTALAFLPYLLYFEAPSIFFFCESSACPPSCANFAFPFLPHTLRICLTRFLFCLSGSHLGFLFGRSPLCVFPPSCSFRPTSFLCGPTIDMPFFPSLPSLGSGATYQAFFRFPFFFLSVTLPVLSGRPQDRFFFVLTLFSSIGVEKRSFDSSSLTPPFYIFRVMCSPLPCLLV